MSNITEIISAVSNVFQAGAVVATVWVAYRGLTSWQEQQIGKRKFEVAEQALTVLYEARDAISSARFPLAFAVKDRRLRLRVANQMSY